MCIKRQRGVTLVELVIFMVIVGVAAAGIMGVMNLGARNSADPVRRKQALMIAEAFMEEVQMAHFTYCDASDPKVSTANSPSDCTTPVTIGIPSGSRPYANVANYAAQEGVASHTFAVNGVDVDISGRPLGQDASLNTMGNSLAGYTTTVTLHTLAGSDALGPSGNAISSDTTPANLNVLRITVTTAYGSGSSEKVILDGYRTRYAPTYAP